MNIKELLKIIDRSIDSVLSERTKPGKAVAGIKTAGIASQIQKQAAFDQLVKRRNPHSLQSLLDYEKTIWNKDTLKASLFGRQLGLPSIIDIIKATSKDKDILTMVDLMSNKEYMQITHLDRKENVLGSMSTKLQKVDPEKHPLLGGGTDKDTGKKQLKLYWGFLIQSSESAGHMAVLKDMFKENFKKWDEIGKAIQKHMIARSSNPIFDFSDDEGLQIAANDVNQIKEDTDEGEPETPSETTDVEDDIHFMDLLARKDGFIRFDKKGVGNFIRFCGFIKLLNISVTIVHELAHAYDPDNPWNKANTTKELMALYYPGEGETEETELGAHYGDLKSRAEMFATNRTKDYISDVSKSELFKAVFDINLLQGPVKVSKSLTNFNLSKFAVSSWLSGPKIKYIPDELNSSDYIETLKQGNMPHAIGWEADFYMKEMKARWVKDRYGLSTWYANHCAQTMYLKDYGDIERQSLAGMAQGEHPDRLAKYSPEDRENMRQEN